MKQDGPSREHPRRRDDLRGRHAGLPLGPCGRAGADALCERIEAVAPVRHVVAVVEALVDQHLGHRERDRAVGARPRPQPEIRHLGRRGPERVDDQDARAARLRLLERHPLRRIGDQRIAPDDHDAGRVVEVLAARDVEAGHLLGHAAAAAAQILVDQPVRRAERARQQRHHEAAGKERAAHRARDGEGAMLVADAREAVGHLVERIVPRDRSERPAAALADAAQRRAQPLLLIGPFLQRADALDAERAARTRMRGVRRDFGHLAVLDGEERAAQRGALPAGAGDDLRAGRLGRTFIALGYTRAMRAQAGIRRGLLLIAARNSPDSRASCSSRSRTIRGSDRAPLATRTADAAGRPRAPIRTSALISSARALINLRQPLILRC